MAKSTQAIAGILVASTLFSPGMAGSRRPEPVRVAVVTRQPGNWAAAGIARGVLAAIAQLERVWPANATVAQRLVPAEPDAPADKVAEAGRRLRCRFVVTLDVRERGEVAAEVVETLSGARQRILASGALHELPGLLALALAKAMRLDAAPSELARLAAPAVGNEAAAEALWRGDAASKPEEQAQHYEAGLKADPNSALLHNQLGAALARGGQAERALAEFDQAIKLSPGYAAAHTNRGLVLKQEKRWKEAEEAFRTAIRLGAKSPTPHIQLARLLDRVGAIMEAVEELERAVEADPSHVEALMTLADSYFESYNLRAAHQMAQRTLEVEPENTGALNLIGLLLLVPQEYEEAEVAFLRALTAKPDDPESLSNLALALYGQGEATMAIGLLERVIAREPSFANAYLYLGRIHLAQKHPREAAEALQRASELRPTLGAAQRGLAAARQAAAPQQGCGCLGVETPFSSLMSANQLVGPLLPVALLLAPHVVRLGRRRARFLPGLGGPLHEPASRVGDRGACVHWDGHGAPGQHQGGAGPEARD